MSSRYPRSLYDKTGGLVYFARMLDKIRLHAALDLPKDYHENLGSGFDGRCCAFLAVKYDDLRRRTLEGDPDEEILEWCCTQGRRASADEIQDWNEFMLKRGWRDSAAPRLKMRLKEAGLEKHTPPILTFFDFIEVDEKRTPPVFP
jgi:gluconokinase